ncbi:hypothetical protein JX266_001348 [Neoarthrinium moseri]|nr:hypothetical protein JX266_001348 [Neoarthrinium moseri]
MPFWDIIQKSRISMTTPAASVSPPETARLDTYIQKAWKTNEQLHPFGVASDESAATNPAIAPPTLRRGKTNRIIYYIGSFNPPHLGHQALMDHVLEHSRHEADPDFNAVAIIAITHGERWVQRKLARESRTTPASPQGGGLHLPFDQRKALLEQGLPASLRRRGVWVFPRPLDDWFGFLWRLMQACQDDGFALEMHELLGPDYVEWWRPQKSGLHGVVTSDVCRPADFVVPGSPELEDMVGFAPWERVITRDGGEGDEDGVGSSSSQGQGQEQTGELEAKKGEVWVCRESGRRSYTIRFVKCEERALDPNLSSTKLRQIIAGADTDELLDKVRGAAMSPEMLVEMVRERRKN